MSISTFLHNIGDIIEGVERKLGFSPASTKAIRNRGVDVLEAFYSKWKPDSTLMLLGLAKGYVDTVKVDPSTFLAAAQLLFTSAIQAELKITLDDAKDALRTAFIAGA